MNRVELWLHEQSRAGRDLFLMLDSDGQSEARTALAADLGTERFRHLYAGTAAESLAQTGPLLLQIDTARHPVILSLLDTPDRHWGWLASAEHVALDDLASHWRERVVTGDR